MSGRRLSSSASEDVLQDVFRIRLQKTSSRRLDQGEYIYLSHMSSEDVLIETNIFILVICLQDVFKTSWKNVFKTSSRRFENVLKTSSRHLQDVLARCLQDVFKMLSRNLAKTSSRHLEDVLQRYLQDVFKTYHQAKLFLLTRPKDVFETYSTCFWDVLQRRLSTEGFA